MNIRTATKGTQVRSVPTAPINAGMTQPAEVKEVLSEARDTVSPVAEDEDFEGNGLIEEYMRFITDHGLTKDDVFQLLDAIMTSGYIEWDTSINNGKTPLRFRMRPVWAEDLIAKNIDALSSDKNLSMARFSNVLRMMNLAASLVLFGTQEFNVTDEESFNACLDFIKGLPYPVFASMTMKLAVFDRAVAIALSDWGMKNFTGPQKESS